MIKAICFDLDGVYFLNGKYNFIKALEKLGVSEDVAKTVDFMLNQGEFTVFPEVGMISSRY